MKRALFSVLIAAVMCASSGCCLLDRVFCCHRGYGRAPAGCESCGGGGFEGGCASCGMADARGGRGMRRGTGGDPMMGAVTYPYYTSRGPRDFLAKNPPSIGP